MAKSTYLELVNRAIRECGVSGGALASIQSQLGERNRVIQWVADADMFIQKLYLDWNFLHSTGSFNVLTNTADYNKIAKTGLIDTDSVYLDFGTASAIRLQELEYIDYRNLIANGADTGTPSRFILKPNSDIALYPTPIADSILTMDYWKYPTRLATNDSTSDIPEEFEDAIIYRVKVMYAQHEEANDMLQYATREYDVAVSDLMASQAPHHYAKNMASNDIVIRTE